LYLVFGGEQRNHAYHPHESPRVMTWPLIVLAVLVTVGGLLNAPPLNLLTRFLDSETVPFALGIAGVSVGIAALGWLAAWSLYGRQPLLAGQADPLQSVLGPAYTLLERKFFVDELYSWLFVRPYQRLSDFTAFVIDQRFLHDFVHDTLLIGTYQRFARLLAGPIDRRLIDRGSERLAVVVRDLSNWLRAAQSGYVRRYVVWFVLGAVLVMGYFAVRTLR
jgi:NADH-quinone oxidoreductase subunit L